MTQDPSTGRLRRADGQSLTEFALIIPLLLGLIGLTVDFGRVFQVWISMEALTRDAAEAAATSAKDEAEAALIGQRLVCLGARDISGFVASALAPPDDIEACLQPTATVVSYARSTTDPGASDLYPIATVTIRTTVPFSPLFMYPFIDQAWVIASSSTFSIVQGRK